MDVNRTDVNARAGDGSPHAPQKRMGGKLRLPRRGEAGYEEAKRALTKRGKKLWKKIQNHDQVLAAQARMRAEQAQRMAAQEQQMNRLAQAKK